MEGHPDGTITVPALAKAIGLSRRHLERLFMSKLKMSPASAYKQMRMDRAKLLLAQSRAPLIEVALEAGFVNTSHFSRVFKALYGKTPNEYRRAASADKSGFEQGDSLTARVLDLAETA